MYFYFHNVAGILIGICIDESKMNKMNLIKLNILFFVSEFLDGIADGVGHPLRKKQSSSKF
jgi:hypothetical protein